MPNANNIDYRVACDAEILQARSLFEIAFGQSATEEKWRYKYFENPAGPVVAFAAFDGEKLVSILPSHPSRFSVSGEEITIYQSGDIMTHPDYRRRGIYNRLKEMSGEWMKAQGVPFTIGFPNANALLANKKFGYTVLGRMTRWARILDPGGESPGRKALAYAAYPFLSALRRKHEAKNVAPITSFPDGVAEISRRFGERNPICGIRNADFLKWRYPKPGSEITAWVSNPDNPDGYLVAERSEKGFWIRDIVVDPASKGSAANLFAAVSNYAGGEGARHIVFQYLGKFYDSMLLKSGFLPAPGRAYVTLHPYSTDIPGLSNRRNWYIADADRDMEL